MKKILFALAVIAIIGFGAAILLNYSPKIDVESEKILVVTTLFPQYDFAKEIGGDKVDVLLLLPPGVEPHAYEPKPSDIAKINNAEIFIYTGEFMEPWAHDIIKSINKKVKIVNASIGVEIMQEYNHDYYHKHDHEEADNHEDNHDHNYSGVDPHIWLDFANAQIMAENIVKAFLEVDPQNAQYYQDNFDRYKSKFIELDNVYKNTIAFCESKKIIYGGHYAFGYLTKRYGLKYVSARGFSPDSEPTAKEMIDLVKQIRQENISHIFYEELTSPKVAETLANETNAELLLLNNGENLTKEDYEAGETFISIMEKNLKNISLGLDCSK